MGYQICKRCILDSNIPHLKFSAEGICSVCTEYERRTQDTVKDYAALEKKFAALVPRQNSGGRYDCLCLYSGGKDSTYMLYTLVKKYNLNVLAFTLDNWFLSKQAYLNIANVLSVLNIDHVMFKPSWKLTQSLFKAGIADVGRSQKAQEMAFLIGHVCWPCFIMISIFSIKTALEKKIPAIVVGATPGQFTQKEGTLATKYSSIIDVYRNMVLPFLEIIPRQERKALDLPLGQKLKSLNLKLVPFYEHHEYCEEKIFKTDEKELGWKRPEDTDSCSTNCSINSLGIALHRKKYNVSPYAIPLAHDVRAGLMNREKALGDISAAVDENLVRELASRLGVGV